MPSKQKNRGQHPEDPTLFGPKHLPALRAATADLSWLLSRDYPLTAALKLVGDRYRLNVRQRKPVQRCACSDAQQAHRRTRQLLPAALAGRSLQIDGFNILISVEAALSGALLFRARDGAIRDIASIHGSYRRVNQTPEAIALIGEMLTQLSPAGVTWYLDQPVSNSGRLKTQLREIAEVRNWDWKIELVYNPDKVIAEQAGVALSGDSWVIDHAEHWFNFLRYLLAERLPEVPVLDLSPPAAATAL
ncbi:MAG: DUF434 domain-containing protein [Bacteroidota bacterium]